MESLVSTTRDIMISLQAVLRMQGIDFEYEVPTVKFWCLFLNSTINRLSCLKCNACANHVLAFLKQCQRAPNATHTQSAEILLREIDDFFVSRYMGKPPVIAWRALDRLLDLLQIAGVPLPSSSARSSPRPSTTSPPQRECSLSSLEPPAPAVSARKIVQHCRPWSVTPEWLALYGRDMF